MKQLSHTPLLFALLLIACAHSAFAQGDLDSIRPRITSGYYFTSKRFPPATPLMSDIMNKITADGSFNRTDKTPTEQDLVQDILKLAKVFTFPDSSTYYQSPAVKEKLYKALHYWLGKFPAWKWTGSAMAQPDALGYTLLKIYSHIKADATDPLYGSIVNSIKTRAASFIRYSWAGGGAGNTFLTPNLGTNGQDDWHRIGNVAYRMYGYVETAVAIENTQMMDTLSIIINNQIPYMINKPASYAVAALYDGSLHQHGPQIYNTGYGNDWLSFIGNYASWAKTGKWKLSTSHQQIWGETLLNGQQWMSYKGYTAHNIVGRHNLVKGSVKHSYYGALNAFVSAADTSLSIYKTVETVKNKSSVSGYQMDSTKYFWNSQVIFLHAARYFASIRMLSNRVVGVESSDAGGAGLMNFHVADGSTFIYRKGTEYDNARGAYNWRAIPGATIKQKNGTLPLVPWAAGYESNNDIAGGVSNGAVSIGGFYLSRTHSYHKTKAFKSYFAFKDILLCMGNSITDTDGASGDIYTTINQTEQLTNIYYSLNGGAEQSLTLGTNGSVATNITAPTWIWHDSIGYVIIPRTAVPTGMLLWGVKKTGNWSTLDSRNPNQVDTVNIFQLSINHGAPGAWKDTTYRYLVMPSVTKAELVSFFNNKVMASDSTSLYIDYNSNKVISASYNGYTGVLFVGAGHNKATGLGADSLNISSDNYAAVLIKRKGNGIDLSVADMKTAFNSTNKVALGINRILQGTAFPGSNANGPCTISSAADSSTISLYLSKTNEIYTGSPVQVNTVFLSPFPGAILPIPGKIEAEDFDLGGNTISWVDNTAGNSGGKYRTNTDVDIENTGDAGGGFNIGWVAAGEWMEYSVNVASSGTYKMEARVAATTAGRKFHIEMDGQDISGPVNVPNTGAYQTYHTVSLENIPLTEGVKKMKMVMDSAAFNLNYVTFSLQPAATVYQHCSYGGYSVLLLPGDYTMTQLQTRSIVNDDISSLKVPAGYEAVLYESDNFSGASITKTADDACLIDDAFNDKITSIRLQLAGSALLSNISAVTPAIDEPDVMLYYPNPVRNACTIQSKKLINGITICTMNGTIVKRIINLATHRYVINTSGLGKGTYLVAVHVGKGTFVRKLVKVE